VDARLENFVYGGGCGFWYFVDRLDPWNECKACYWGVPVDHTKVITRRMMIWMMARQPEELIEAEAA
jgi:hypothetical protein